MKSASVILALFAVLTLGAAEARSGGPTEEQPRAAAKKKSESQKGHKHKPGEKHRDGDEKPKSKAKS